MTGPEDQADAFDLGLRAGVMWQNAIDADRVAEEPVEVGLWADRIADMIKYAVQARDLATLDRLCGDWLLPHELDEESPG